MRTARFRIELAGDNWIRQLSREHPDAEFRLLSGIEKETRATELGEIRATPAEPVADALREHSSIVSYERLHVDERRALARYEVTDLGLYGFLRAMDVPPEFPIVAGDGCFEIEVTASTGRLRQIRENLAAGDVPHEVLFVAGTKDAEELLTDRQREVLETAFRAGYFEVPREANLEDVAVRLGVDKSTVSGVLRRAQGKVLGRFLSDPGRRIGH